VTSGKTKEEESGKGGGEGKTCSKICPNEGKNIVGHMVLTFNASAWTTCALEFKKVVKKGEGKTRGVGSMDLSKENPARGRMYSFQWLEKKQNCIDLSRDLGKKLCSQRGKKGQWVFEQIYGISFSRLVMTHPTETRH